MSIAENRLTVDLVKEKLQSTPSFPDSVFFYDNMTGSDRLKAAMVGLVQRTFMQVPILFLLVTGAHLVNVFNQGHTLHVTRSTCCQYTRSDAFRASVYTQAT